MRHRYAVVMLTLLFGATVSQGQDAPCTNPGGCSVAIDPTAAAYAHRPGFISLTGEADRTSTSYAMASNVLQNAEMYHNIGDLLLKVSTHFSQIATGMDAQNAIKSQLENVIQAHLAQFPGTGALVQVHAYQEPSTGQIGLAGVYLMGYGKTPKDAFDQWTGHPNVIPGLPTGMLDSPESSFRVWYKSIGGTVMPVPLYQMPGLQDFTSVKDEQKHGLLWMKTFHDMVQSGNIQYTQDVQAQQNKKTADTKMLADEQQQYDQLKQTHVRLESQRDVEVANAQSSAGTPHPSSDGAPAHTESDSTRSSNQAEVDAAKAAAQQQREQDAAEEHARQEKIQEDNERVAKEQSDEDRRIQNEKDQVDKAEEEEKKHENEVVSSPNGLTAPPDAGGGSDDHPLPPNISIFASKVQSAEASQVGLANQSKLATMMQTISTSSSIAFVNPGNGKLMQFSQRAGK
jgi:hypothetical protein